MKRITLFLAIIGFSLISWQLSAQSGPPNPGDRPSTTPLGGGSAPIGSGTLLMLGLGAAYAVKKYHDHRQSDAFED